MESERSKSIPPGCRACLDEIDRLTETIDRLSAALDTVERDTLDRVEVALRDALSQTGDTAFASAVYIVAGLRMMAGLDHRTGADDGL